MQPDDPWDEVLREWLLAGIAARRKAQRGVVFLIEVDDTLGNVMGDDCVWTPTGVEPADRWRGYAAST